MSIHQTEAEALTRADPGPAAPPPRPPARGYSMRPAMIVLGLAALILGLFVTIGVLSSSAPVSVRHSASPSAVPGSTLRAMPAAPDLAVIVAAGEPPTNILNAVFVPVGSVRLSHHSNSGSAGQFDSQIRMRADASQGALEVFFADEMQRQGWQVFDRGPAANTPGATEVLGKLAGSDGYYWEMGAVVSPTTFGPGAPPAGDTHFTIRLFQVPDPE